MAILLAGQLALNNLNTPGAGGLLFESLGWKPVLKGIGYTLSILTGVWPMHLYLGSINRRRELLLNKIAAKQYILKEKNSELQLLRTLLQNTQNSSTFSMFYDQITGIVNYINKYNTAQTRIGLSARRYIQNIINEQQAVAKAIAATNKLPLDEKLIAILDSDLSDEKFAAVLNSYLNNLANAKPQYDELELQNMKIVNLLIADESGALQLNTNKNPTATNVSNDNVQQSSMSSQLRDRIKQAGIQLGNVYRQVTNRVYNNIARTYQNILELNDFIGTEKFVNMLSSVGILTDERMRSRALAILGNQNLSADRKLRWLLRVTLENRNSLTGDINMVRRLLTADIAAGVDNLSNEIRKITNEISKLSAKQSKLAGRGMIGLLIGTAAAMTLQLGALGTLIAINRRIANLSQQQLYPGAIVSGVYF